jgi:hypothetical protein
MMEMSEEYSNMERFFTEEEESIIEMYYIPVYV